MTLIINSDSPEVGVAYLGIMGPPGPSTNISIGTVGTLAPGLAATAAITGEAPNLFLNMNIPRGAKLLFGAGVPGTPGSLNALDGDVYFRANGQVYRVVASEWVLSGDVTGPQGQTPELSIDEATNTIRWRYVGGTDWTPLIVLPTVAQLNAIKAETEAVRDATDDIRVATEVVLGQTEDVKAATEAVRDQAEGFKDDAEAAAASLDVAAIYAAIGEKADAADLAAKAPLESPALTGNPTAPTQSVGNNSTRVATTAFVVSEINENKTWFEIASINAAVNPGPSLTFSSIPDGADILLSCDGIGHNDGSLRSVQVSVSADNGSNWSGSVMLTSAFNNSGTAIASVVIHNFKDDISHGYASGNSVAPSSPGIAVQSQGVGGIGLKHTGGINAIRLTLGGSGNFNKGVARLFMR